MKGKKFSFVIVFVILLVTVTVFSWKSCSDQYYETNTENKFNQSNIVDSFTN